MGVREDNGEEESIPGSILWHRPSASQRTRHTMLGGGVSRWGGNGVLGVARVAARPATTGGRKRLTGRRRQGGLEGARFCPNYEHRRNVSYLATILLRGLYPRGLPCCFAIRVTDALVRTPTVRSRSSEWWENFVSSFPRSPVLR